MNKGGIKRGDINVYYLVVWRPRGSKSWMPADVWRLHRYNAESCALGFKERNPDKEYAVGEVRIIDKEDKSERV